MPYYLILSQNKNPFISLFFFLLHYDYVILPITLRTLNLFFHSAWFLFTFFPFSLVDWLILVEWWSSIITGITWLCFLSKQRKVRNLRKNLPHQKRLKTYCLHVCFTYVCIFMYPFMQQCVSWDLIVFWFFLSLFSKVGSCCSVHKITPSTCSMQGNKQKYIFSSSPPYTLILIACVSLFVLYLFVYKKILGNNNPLLKIMHLNVHLFRCSKLLLQKKITFWVVWPKVNIFCKLKRTVLIRKMFRIKSVPAVDRLGSKK